MACGPVVASTGLPEDEVVRAEELPERASAHGVHRARLEVHEDRARDVAAASRLIEDGFGDGDRGGTLQLEAGCSASFTRMAQIAWLMTRPIFHVNVESENCKWASLKYTLMRSSCKSESPWYVPVGSMPCSSEITCTRGSVIFYLVRFCFSNPRRQDNFDPIRCHSLFRKVEKLSVTFLSLTNRLPSSRSKRCALVLDHCGLSS